MVDDFLAREPVRLLLKKRLTKEEEIDLHKLLIPTYRNTADISVAHTATRGFLELYRRDKLEKTFHVASDMLTAHEYHFPKGDTRLDGCRVLFVIRPAIIRRYITEDCSTECKIVNKEIVIVEDPKIQVDTKAEVHNNGKAEDQALCDLCSALVAIIKCYLIFKFTADNYYILLFYSRQKYWSLYSALVKMIRSLVHSSQLVI